eukprot:TRINITY_DN17273_c0_g1_i1.p1 TRINITY_DN17273_c0_g1~~TRINITY_DN17273_c0_g1_i1.p1  ORF type:complete len:480 (-),score=71.88 TRINITY_DN17273_c0_g1_i1:104-1501(-)
MAFQSFARRLLAFALGHLCLPGFAQFCAPPDHQEDDACAHGGCCHELTGAVAQVNNWWIHNFSARTGVAPSVRTQISHCDPLGPVMGVSDVLERPLSVEVLQGSPMKLELQIHVHRILSILPKAQTFEMQYQLKWVWRDCRLLYNCSFEVVVVDSDPTFQRFWKPRWQISTRQSEVYHLETQDFKILPNGLVEFTEEHISTFKCPMDFSNMPFDVQRCSLSVTLPGMKNTEISLAWLGITSDELTSTEWVIDQGPTWSTLQNVRGIASTSYNSGYKYSELVAEFKLTRRPGFLITQFWEPVLLFYILSYIGLFIDVNAVPARVAAGVIPALTTSNKMSALSATLPPISYTTRLSKCMSFNLIIIVLHFVEYGFVNWCNSYLKRLASNKKIQIEPPKLVMEDVIEEGKTWAAARPKDDGAPPVEQEPVIDRCLRHLARFGSRYCETLTRILSPIVYIVAIAIIFYA